MAADMVREMDRSKKKEVAPLPKRPAAAAPRFDDSALVKVRVPEKVLVLFTRQFATLIDAGIPLVRSLQALRAQNDCPAFERIVEGLCVNIESGRPLSRSMGRYPNVFKKVYVSMVKAGEANGMLADCLQSLARYLEKEQETRQKIVAVMTYPAVIFTVAVLLQYCMVNFLMPHFISIFEGMNMKLPFITKALIAVTHFCQDWRTLVVIGITAALGWLMWRQIMNSAAGRQLVDEILLQIPLIGPFLHKIILVRLSRTLSAMMGSGVPMMLSLQLSAAVTGNRVYQRAVELVTQQLETGCDISSALEQTGLFDRLFVQLVSVGEITGTMDDLLERLADYYEEEVNRTLAGLPALVEPIMMAAIGLMVGVVLLAIFLPLYSMVTQMG